MSSELKELYDIQAALNTTTILAITDTKGKIIFANAKFCEISKYSPEELIGKTHKIVNSGYHEPEFFKNLWLTISQGKKWRGEIQNRAKDGSLYWVDTYIIPFLNNQGQPYQYVSIRHDITNRKLLEHRIQQQLITDSITGLPNTYYLKTSVEKLIVMKEQFNLLLINVDDFKSFNESLGNFEADHILRLIGERLNEIVKGNRNILAKTYGDEFALIILGDTQSARFITCKIFEIFREPIKYSDIDYYITISIGAVHYPTHAKCYEELYYNANRSLQLAKFNGKNTFTFNASSPCNAYSQASSIDSVLHLQLPAPRSHSFAVQTSAQLRCLLRFSALKSCNHCFPLANVHNRAVTLAFLIYSPIFAFPVQWCVLLWCADIYPSDFISIACTISVWTLYFSAIACNRSLVSSYTARISHCALFQSLRNIAHLYTYSDNRYVVFVICCSSVSK